jgi:hypothetical protein
MIMPQYMPVLRDVPIDHVDPSFRERPVASDGPYAETQGVTGGVRVIEAEDDAAADRVAYASLHLRGLLDTQARHHPRDQPWRDAWMKALDEICAASTRGRRGAVRASARRAVADPVARAGAEAGCPVAGIGEPAALDREAAASDAFGEPKLETLELGDALIDPRCPCARETRPISSGRRAVRRQLDKFRADLVERPPDPLGEDDERDPSEHGPRVATVTRAGPFGRDQPSLLVEAERRSRHAAAPRDLADREQGEHATK